MFKELTYDEYFAVTGGKVTAKKVWKYVKKGAKFVWSLVTEFARGCFDGSH